MRRTPVENDDRDYEEVNEAINKFNEKSYSEPLEILRANDPEDMKAMLAPHFDIVLADVYFDDPKTGERDKVDRLEDIIKYVRCWGDEYNGGRPLPIIAYSRIATLEYCFKWNDSLYDIWDKNTAFAEYVTWRLSKLAVEISRIQPDSHLQRLIREMTNGASWHENVKEMAKDYNSGWTEIDQIERAGHSVYKIAGHLEVFEACQPLWDIITEGEAITRAISHRSRGQARHVINVFWLGYYLLHHQYLHDWFAYRWQDLLNNRSKMGEVRDDDPFEALSNIWFYAGLFHDVGRAVEKLKEFSAFHDKLFQAFRDLPVSLLDLDKVNYPAESLKKQVQDLASEIGNPVGSLIK